MIVHVVALSWKSGTSPDEIESILQELATLEGQIGGIDVCTGENGSPAPSAYTHAAVVMASSEESFEAYLHHPAHLAVATTIGERAETALVIDLWHNGLKAKPNDRPNAEAR